MYKSELGTPRHRFGAENTPEEKTIRFRTNFSNTILDVMLARGWQKVGENDAYDFHWCEVGWLKDYFDNSFLPENVKICHFRNYYELTRKNLMVKNLKKMKKQFEKETGQKSDIDFFPVTFDIPNDYHLFVEEYRKERRLYDEQNKGLPVWIMKPTSKAQGRGIFLFHKLKEIEDWRPSTSDIMTMNKQLKTEFVGDGITKDPNANPNITIQQGVTGPSQPEPYVVSKYIERPYLINRKKFDIRMYVLVESFSPLKVWTHRDGFARFSNEPYTVDNIKDAIVHLTNVAIQKTDPNYDPENGQRANIF